MIKGVEKVFRVSIFSTWGGKYAREIRCIRIIWMRSDTLWYVVPHSYFKTRGEAGLQLLQWMCRVLVSYVYLWERYKSVNVADISHCVSDDFIEWVRYSIEWRANYLRSIALFKKHSLWKEIIIHNPLVGKHLPYHKLLHLVLQSSTFSGKIFV